MFKFVQLAKTDQHPFRLDGHELGQDDVCPPRSIQEQDQSIASTCARIS